MSEQGETFCLALRMGKCFCSTAHGEMFLNKVSSKLEIFPFIMKFKNKVRKMNSLHVGEKRFEP